MKYFKNLKTSEKISLSFSLFSFFTLVVLLVTINITYFYIWYSDQKNQSFYDMEQNYSQSYVPTDEKSAENFKNFLLQSDTLIIPKDGDPVCSPWVLAKMHGDQDLQDNRFFYKTDDTLYFIYSREYEGIGEVRVFFDTTSYIHSQLIIIRISLVIIFIAFFLHFFIGKFMSQRLLRGLTSISDKFQWFDANSKLEKIQCSWPDTDEIQILATTLNKSFEKIETQTQNLKQFITDVSHEFKTPLMSINSKIDVIEKKSKISGTISLQENTDFLQYIKHQTTKLNTLLETLFLISRFEENIQKLDCKTINFSEYIQKKAQVFFEAFPAVKIHTEIHPDVYFDIEDTTCNIIIENLFTNAVKFADTKNPVITIGCDESGFWIQDNGKWMTPQEIQQSTEKFFKSDRNKEWFGIGLFLVKRIVKMYGGDICFSSKVGKWTTVKVTFT